jgi:hypothetical protein
VCSKARLNGLSGHVLNDMASDDSLAGGVILFAIIFLTRGHAVQSTAIQFPNLPNSYGLQIALHSLPVARGSSAAVHWVSEPIG